MKLAISSIQGLQIGKLFKIETFERAVHQKLHLVIKTVLKLMFQSNGCLVGRVLYPRLGALELFQLAKEAHCVSKLAV